jgi:stage V sporulation protein S
MNRFFSNLDLRDIKIDPEGTRFPPDADDAEEVTDSVEVTDVAPAHNGDVEEPTAHDGHQPELVADDIAAAGDGYGADAAAPLNGNGFAVDTAVATVEGEVLKVSARSRPSAVAGAIAGVVREAGRAEVQAIGAGATNQAVKAVAIARDYLRETGIDAVCLPAFIDVTIENEDRTAIRLIVEPR